MVNRPSLDILQTDYHNDPRIQELIKYTKLLEYRMDRLATRVIDKVETAAHDAVHEWEEGDKPETHPT